MQADSGPLAKTLYGARTCRVEAGRDASRTQTAPKEVRVAVLVEVAKCERTLQVRAHEIIGGQNPPPPDKRGATRVERGVRPRRWVGGEPHCSTLGVRRYRSSDLCAAMPQRHKTVRNNSQRWDQIKNLYSTK